MDFSIVLFPVCFLGDILGAGIKIAKQHNGGADSLKLKNIQFICSGSIRLE